MLVAPNGPFVCPACGSSLVVERHVMAVELEPVDAQTGEITITGTGPRQVTEQIELAVACSACKTDLAGMFDTDDLFVIRTP